MRVRLAPEPLGDSEYWIERGMDYLSDTLRAEAYPAESGMPLADFECKHGHLAQDTNISCTCWHTPDMMEELMSKLHEKSHNKILFACDNTHCIVVTFAANSVKEDTCPKCGKIALPIRGPLPDDPRRAGSKDPATVGT